MSFSRLDALEPYFLLLLISDFFSHVSVSLVHVVNYLLCVNLLFVCVCVCIYCLHSLTHTHPDNQALTSPLRIAFSSSLLQLSLSLSSFLLLCVCVRAEMRCHQKGISLASISPHSSLSFLLLCVCVCERDVKGTGCPK